MFVSFIVFIIVLLFPLQPIRIAFKLNYVHDNVIRTGDVWTRVYYASVIIDVNYTLTDQRLHPSLAYQVMMLFLQECLSWIMVHHVGIGKVNLRRWTKKRKKRKEVIRKVKNKRWICIKWSWKWWAKRCHQPCLVESKEDENVQEY